MIKVYFDASSFGEEAVKVEINQSILGVLEGTTQSQSIEVSVDQVLSKESWVGPMFENQDLRVLSATKGELQMMKDSFSQQLAYINVLQSSKKQKSSRTVRSLLDSLSSTHIIYYYEKDHDVVYYNKRVKFQGFVLNQMLQPRLLQ